MVHDDAEMDDVVRGLGDLDDEWDEEEGDDEVYDHGGINPYYGFWAPDPDGYDDEQIFDVNMMVPSNEVDTVVTDIFEDLDDSGLG